MSNSIVWIKKKLLYFKWIAHVLRFPRKLSENIRIYVSPYFYSIKVQKKYLNRNTSKRHDLPSHLIVSLTSYPARFNTLHLTLKCLLSQTVLPDKIILWIAYVDKDKLTEKILEFQKYGLTISFCEDLRSYKKIIPALQLYKDSFIITADDDLYYWPTWLEELVSSFSGDNSQVLCHRAHRITINNDGLPTPYREWEMETRNLDMLPLIFPTSGAGALYPPNIFYDDVIKPDIFKKVCPNADDIWLYWMMRLKGVSAKKIGKRRHLICWQGTQRFGLVTNNVFEGGNDKQVNDMTQLYGFPF